MGERSAGLPTPGVGAEGEDPRLLRQAIPSTRRQRRRRSAELVVRGKRRAPAQQTGQGPTTAAPAAEAKAEGTGSLPEGCETSTATPKASSSARAAVDTAIEFVRRVARSRERDREPGVRKTTSKSRGGSSSAIRLWKR